MKRLLVVIDYQNDFVDGTLGFEKAKTLEPLIFDKVNEYLNNGEKVLFTYDTHYDNYLQTREGRHLPIVHCVKGTNGHNLYGRINEFVIKENTLHYDKEGFGISPKDMIKIADEIGNDIDEIEIVGVVTNICVISNTILFQSQYRNAEVIVDAKLCASFNQELHEEALDVAEGLQVIVKNRG